MSEGANAQNWSFVQNSRTDGRGAHQLTLSRRLCFPPPGTWSFPALYRTFPPLPPACSPCNFHHPPRPTAWPKSGSVAFCFSTTFRLFSDVDFFLRHRRSTACYCWTPQTAHCCGGGSGRLLTNSWRRRRFGLFSTQHSSRTHLAHPLLLFTKTRWICHQHFQCHPGMTVSIASLSESLWGQISPACMNRMFLTFPESTAPCCQQTIVLISWAIAMNLYSSDKGVLMWKRAYFCSQKQSLS